MSAVGKPAYLILGMAAMVAAALMTAAVGAGFAVVGLAMSSQSAAVSSSVGPSPVICPSWGRGVSEWVLSSLYVVRVGSSGCWPMGILR